MAAFFFALLALTALVGAVGLGVLLLAARSDPHGAAARVLDDVAPAALPMAAIVATMSTFGSLWFSEVAGYVPCDLCWFQRIAMYPLAPLLGLAAVRSDPSIRPYGLVLAVSGAIMAGYHTVLQRVPDIDGVGCSADYPCSAAWVTEFGFVTIPVMALSGFLAISALLLVAGRLSSTRIDHDTEPSAEEVLR